MGSSEYCHNCLYNKKEGKDWVICGLNHGKKHQDGNYYMDKWGHCQDYEWDKKTP